MFRFVSNVTLLSLLLFPLPVSAQQFDYVYRTPGDSTVNCYLACVPDGKPIRGIIIRDYSSLPDTSRWSSFRLMDLALEQGVVVLYTVTSRRVPELYYDDSGPGLLDEIVHEVIDRYSIPIDNVVVGGISASGTRALRYAQYCEEGKSRFGIRVKAVFAVDPPLDVERFYTSAFLHRNNFKGGMVWEADLVLKAFPKFLGPYPDNAGAYRSASVFSGELPDGGNAIYYKDLPILFFHEPDIDWWIDARGATYFDINSYDIAGFVRAVRMHGNERVELVTTSGKGFDAEGNRKCHSWTIVDENYLIGWIAGYLE